MAALTLALSEEEIRAILHCNVVYIADGELEPDYDGARYAICRRIMDAHPGLPFSLNAHEAKALLEALSELDMGRFSERGKQILGGIIEDLDAID
jgi:hypothetical protein